MSKVDFKKDWKQLYNPPKENFTIIDVPFMKFLMADGQGLCGPSSGRIVVGGGHGRFHG
jgi:hypothetical protein